MNINLPLHPLPQKNKKEHRIKLSERVPIVWFHCYCLKHRNLKQYKNKPWTNLNEFLFVFFLNFKHYFSTVKLLLASFGHQLKRLMQSRYWHTKYIQLSWVIENRNACTYQITFQIKRMTFFTLKPWMYFVKNDAKYE